jgi:hypothetical protein
MGNLKAAAKYISFAKIPLPPYTKFKMDKWPKRVEHMRISGWSCWLASLYIKLFGGQIN